LYISPLSGFWLSALLLSEAEDHFEIRLQVLERQLNSFFEELAESLIEEPSSKIDYLKGLDYYFVLSRRPVW